MKKIDRSSRAVVLGISLVASAATAPAQNAAAPSSVPQDQVQEVVVTGIRYSLEEALKLKREEVQNVEVIKAEDIGKLPDKNVADAVQRLPGVNTASQAGC